MGRMIARLLRNLTSVETPPPWSFSRGLLVILAALAALIVGALLTINLWGPGGTASLLGWTLGSVVTVVFIWSSFRLHRPALRLEPTQTRLFIVLLFAVGMAMVIDLIDLGITGVFQPAPELLGLLGSEMSFAGWFSAMAFMLIAQPAAEELAFRGILFPSLRSALGGWAGLLVNALLYAGFHLIAYTSGPGHLWHTLGTPFLAGLVIGGVRANTRSTRAAIVAHVGFGIFALLKLIAAT